jgi:hypothetical protein
MNLVRPPSSTDGQQGPDQKQNAKEKHAAGLLDEPFGRPYLAYALLSLQSLQCGEAYYSVYATNNSSFDEPFRGLNG